MNPPEREPAWRYPVRLLAATLVSIGGVVLLLTLLVNAHNWVVMGLLVGLLVPLVRVVADALNPDVPNPATPAGYARRYLAVLLVLCVHLVALAALAPALLLALGVLGAVLGFIVALAGLLLWVLQHWAAHLSLVPGRFEYFFMAFQCTFEQASESAVAAAQDDTPCPVAYDDLAWATIQGNRI